MDRRHLATCYWTSALSIVLSCLLWALILFCVTAHAPAPPFARTHNFFGIHTMLQDGGDMDQHLDWARNLVGRWGYVKQLIYPITLETHKTNARWVEFVEKCYARELIPILRLGGAIDKRGWLKPASQPDGSFSDIAQVVKRVVAQLPRSPRCPLYIEIWNEPNLDVEWEGKPDPAEYGRLLVACYRAIKSIGDSRILVLNGGLAPGGNYNNLEFITAMIEAVPESLWAFDLWASHPYPQNHPPEYNIHDGTARYPDQCIDSYMLELDRLAAKGRGGVKVIATETGYVLGNHLYDFEGYPEITEETMAQFTARAFDQYWRRFPELVAVCPFEMCDPLGPGTGWDPFNWILPGSGSAELGLPTTARPVYWAVQGLDKPGQEREVAW